MLHSWTATWKRYPACSALQPGLRPPFSATLFLYFDQALDGGAQSERAGQYNSTLLRETLLSTWHSLPHQHCFTGGVQFIDMRRGDLNHIQGSCVMFYELFTTLESQHFQHFMWMEPDVLPVQTHWLERMTEEVADNAQCQRWWIKGSNPRCARWYGRIRDRRDYHLNGNALYSLGSSRFSDFRQRVIDFYPGGTHPESAKAGGCATGADYELGMDHAMYQYRLQADTFEYSKAVMGKFVYSDFIQNHCQEPYAAEQVTHDEQATYLVHPGTSFRHPSLVTVQQTQKCSSAVLCGSRVVQQVLYGNCISVDGLTAGPTASTELGSPIPGPGMATGDSRLPDLERCGLGNSFVVVRSPLAVDGHRYMGQRISRRVVTALHVSKLACEVPQRLRLPTQPHAQSTSDSVFDGLFPHGRCAHHYAMRPLTPRFVESPLTPPSISAASSFPSSAPPWVCS